jgi:DNA-binding CsgD family transcriptional regulator
MDDVIWRAKPTEPLTKAEEKLLELLRLGMNGQDVAITLDIAPDEVRTRFRAFS